MKKAVASALVVALAVATAGCSGSPHHVRTTPVAAESTPTPEPLTPQTAARAFRAYVANEDIARTSGDERLALWWTSEGQSQLTAAAFRQAAAAGDPVPRYRYDSPMVYVPRLLPVGTQWFVVSARRTTADGKDPHTVLMGFVNSKFQQRWRLSVSTVLDKKQKLPKIAVDGEGYARPLATFDSALVIPPRVVPSIQATLAEEGPGNVATKVMATGKHTTDFYSGDQKYTKSKKSSGLRSNTLYAATSYPIFPLATADGGGIVLYALSRDVILSKSKKKSGHVPVSKDAAPFLTDPAKVRHTLDVSQTMQFAALVPQQPKKGASTDKAVIIAADGATTNATVSTK